MRRRGAWGGEQNQHFNTPSILDDDEWLEILSEAKVQAWGLWNVGYEENVVAATANDFSTAAFRSMHSLVELLTHCQREKYARIRLCRVVTRIINKLGSRSSNIAALQRHNRNNLTDENLVSVIDLIVLKSRWRCCSRWLVVLFPSRSISHSTRSDSCFWSHRGILKASSSFHGKLKLSKVIRRLIFLWVNFRHSWRSSRGIFWVMESEGNGLVKCDKMSFMDLGLWKENVSQKSITMWQKRMESLFEAHRHVKFIAVFLSAAYVCHLLDYNLLVIQ